MQETIHVVRYRGDGLKNKIVDPDGIEIEQKGRFWQRLHENYVNLRFSVGRYAPSLVWRGDMHLLGIERPRWVTRVHLFECYGERERYIGFLNLRPSYWLEQKGVAPIADAYIAPPSRMYYPPYHLTTIGDYASFHGELPLSCLPYTTPHHEFGGLCAQACVFMALVMMVHYGASVFGTFEVTAVAHNKAANFSIGGLTLIQVTKALQAAGIGAVHETVPVRQREDIVGLLLRSYLTNGFPIILNVDYSRLYPRQDTSHMGDVHRVAICGSDSDTNDINSIEQRLKRIGIEVWNGYNRVTVGESVEHAVKRGIDKSEALLLCLSEQSLTPQGKIRDELRVPLEYWKQKSQSSRVLVVGLTGCSPPEELRDYPLIDPDTEDGWGELMKVLGVIQPHDLILVGYRYDEFTGSGDTQSLNIVYNDSAEGPYMEKPLDDMICAANWHESKRVHFVVPLPTEVNIGLTRIHSRFEYELLSLPSDFINGNPWCYKYHLLHKDLILTTYFSALKRYSSDRYSEFADHLSALRLPQYIWAQEFYESPQAAHADRISQLWLYDATVSSDELCGQAGPKDVDILLGIWKSPYYYAYSRDDADDCTKLLVPLPYLAGRHVCRWR